MKTKNESNSISKLDDTIAKALHMVLPADLAEQFEELTKKERITPKKTQIIYGRLMTDIALTLWMRFHNARLSPVLHITQPRVAGLEGLTPELMGFTSCVRFGLADSSPMG